MKPPVKLLLVPAGIVVLPGPAQVTQQIGLALLLGKADDRVVDTPKVGHQNPVEAGVEQFLQDTAVTPGIDQLVHGILEGRAPQPEGLPLNPPTRLIGVQHGLAPDLVQNAVVPGTQDLTRSVPYLHQPAFRHGEMQVVVVDIQNLPQSHALQVMHYPPQTDGTMPNLAVRQGVLHHRLHLLAAMGAPVPGDQMLGDRWPGI